MKQKTLSVTITLLGLFLAITALAAEKPNIVVIMGDDIGFWNISTNNMGMMA